MSESLQLLSKSCLESRFQKSNYEKYTTYKLTYETLEFSVLSVPCLLDWSLPFLVAVVLWFKYYSAPPNIYLWSPNFSMSSVRKLGPLGVNLVMRVGHSRMRLVLMKQGALFYLSTI
jgi:hypothetical protein